MRKKACINSIDNVNGVAAQHTHNKLPVPNVAKAIFLILDDSEPTNHDPASEHNNAGHCKKPQIVWMSTINEIQPL